jgi:hypothetical protein
MSKLKFSTPLMDEDTERLNTARTEDPELNTYPARFQLNVK